MDRRSCLRWDSFCGNRKSKTCAEQRRSIQNLKWLGLSVIAFVLVVGGTVAQAQQAAKVPRIGYLNARSISTFDGVRTGAFRQGLLELGYVEGKSIVIEWRYGEGKADQAPGLAAELARLKVAVESKEWMDFAKQHGLPNDHWWHIHNLLPTYKVRVRGTKNTWLTLIDKGEITALKSPEIRALASRYGTPEEVLSDDWSPHLPGINAPGKYQDYAKDPWKTLTGVMKRIEAGNYEYFYPSPKAKK